MVIPNPHRPVATCDSCARRITMDNRRAQPQWVHINTWQPLCRPEDIFPTPAPDDLPSASPYD